MIPFLYLENLQIVKETPKKGHETLLDAISLNLAKGEVLGIMGDAECGKSLLLQTLAFGCNESLVHYGGIATLENKDLLTMNKAERARFIMSQRLIYLPANASEILPPFMSVADFSAQYVLSQNKDVQKNEAYERLLQRSLLLDFMPFDRYKLKPTELSKMERLGMSIAVATLLDPDLLLLDGCFDGLEKDEVTLLIAMLRNLIDAGIIKSLVVSTQRNLDLVQRLCTQVAILYAGQIVEIGPIEVVFGYPSHPYTQELFSHIETPKRASYLDASPTGGCKFANECPIFQKDCIEGRILFRTVHDHDVRCLLSR